MKPWYCAIPTILWLPVTPRNYLSKFKYTIDLFSFTVTSCWYPHSITVGCVYVCVCVCVREREREQEGRNGEEGETGGKERKTKDEE